MNFELLPLTTPYIPHCTHDIDAGNTAIKVFFQSTCHRFLTALLLDDFRPLLQLLRTSEEVSIRFRSSLPNVLQKRILNALCEFPVYELKKEHLLPLMKSWHYNTDDLGLDRMVNIVKARQHCQSKGVIVVSAGTATTVDFIHQDAHLGGWIQLGLGLWQSTLPRQIPHLSMPLPVASEHLPTSTAEALAFGGIHPYVEGLRHSIRTMHKKLFSESDEVELILTGGHAEALKTLFQRL
jgi:pantothenate kinase type III